MSDVTPELGFLQSFYASKLTGKRRFRAHPHGFLVLQVEETGEIRHACGKLIANTALAWRDASAMDVSVHEIKEAAKI